MRKALLHSLSVMVLLLGWGCTRERFVPEPEPEVGTYLPFSLSVSQSRNPETKMTADITQQGGEASFRGIEHLYILPFNTTDGVVRAADERWSLNLGLPQPGLPANTFGTSALGGEFEGLVSNSNSHLYDQVYVRHLTNSVLVYGKAPDDQSVEIVAEDSTVFKHRNGYLKGVSLDEAVTPAEIGFDLGPVITTLNKPGFDAWKNRIINYLGAITGNVVKVNGVTKYKFYDPSSYHYHPELTAAFNEFTNEGRMISLSDKTLSQKLTRLFRAVYPYSTTFRNSVEYYEGGVYYVYQLAQKVISSIQNTSVVKMSGTGTSAVIELIAEAPYSYGLPDGVVPIQYREGTNSHAFGTLETYSGVAAIPTNAIYFPPSLWYYVNSPLISTEDPDVVNAYTSVVDEENNDMRPVYWNTIVGQYDHPSVTGSSKAAAVQKPLQYGVSLLSLDMQRLTSTRLPDAKGNQVTISNKKYPLVGIILANQHPVGFDFMPTSADQVRYVYDNDLTDGSAPLAYITSTVGASKTVTMLALPTLEMESVHFALEFRNTSNSSFFAGDGCEIFPGCCFYLLGVLKVADGVNYSGDVITSVFAPDRSTNVKITVQSLANTYSVLPSLDSPQLVLGVQAEMNWDFAVPSIVPIQ